MGEGLGIGAESGKQIFWQEALIKRSFTDKE
jgi:hypothetical protein